MTVTAMAQAPEEAPRKLAIICSKGSLDMAYPALVLANAARMSGVDAMIFFTFWGMDVVTKSKIDHLELSTVGNPALHIPTMVGGLPGMSALATNSMKKKMDKLDLPPIREMVETLEESGAELYACRMAADMMGLGKDDLLPQVSAIISAMDFIEKSEGAQILFI